MLAVSQLDELAIFLTGVGMMAEISLSLPFVSSAKSAPLKVFQTLTVPSEACNYVCQRVATLVWAYPYQ